MRFKLAGFCVLLAVGAFAMQAYERTFKGTYTVTSPDGRNRFVLEASEDLITYSVYHGEQAVILANPISMTLDGGVVLGVGSKVLSTKRTRLNETVKSPFYKKSEVVIQGEQRTITFGGGYAITIAAFDDGVAYRWETALPGEITIINEQAGIKPALDYQGFFSYGNGMFEGDVFQNSWETTYEHCKVSELDHKKLVMLPFYLSLPNGGAMVMSETDLVDYPGLNFFRNMLDPQKLDSVFALFPDLKTIERTPLHLRVHNRLGYIAKTKGTRTFPWRTFTLVKHPPEVMNADLNYKLASACALADTSWIKPGKVAWEWWHSCNLTDVEFKPGCNTPTYKHYIDFAAANGIEYIILDGGWTGEKDIINPSKNVDLPELIRYGNAKNVGLILWAAWPQLYGRQEAVIGHYAQMGAKGFKIDFFDRDDQDVMRCIDLIAQAGAKHKMLIDLHGIFKPAGFQRTYPNVINFEGVFGLEQAKWDDKADFMRHDTILPFTRMVAGPMDYTPGAMGNVTKANFKPNYDAPVAQGTRVHQMALMMMLEAPLQMFCDSPSKYRASPECTEFMAKIPTVWDETIGLKGEPGKYAVIARRKGNVWYVAAVNNWEERTVTVGLNTILKDDQWNSEVFQDGDDAAINSTVWKRRTDLQTQMQSIELAPGGGWIGRFERR